MRPGSSKSVGEYETAIASHDRWEWFTRLSTILGGHLLYQRVNSQVGVFAIVVTPTMDGNAATLRAATNVKKIFMSEMWG